MPNSAFIDGNSVLQQRSMAGAGTEVDPFIPVVTDTGATAAIGATNSAAATTTSETTSLSGLIRGLWTTLIAGLPSKATTTATLLNAVSANGSGTAVDISNFSRITFYFTASGVTSGATLAIEVLAPNATWHKIYEKVITSSTALPPAIVEGAFSSVRATLSSRTDGTYTVGLTAK
jgi:hypothetical protein